MKESKKITHRVVNIITEIYQLKTDIAESYLPEPLPKEARDRRAELDTIINLFSQWAERCQT